MGIVCIIGARKGSKRLPNKNKLLLHQKPLYTYTVEAARYAGIFNHIIFTTDDEEILQKLNTSYSDIIRDQRPPELADDHVVIWDVGIYLLKKYPNIMVDVKTLCFLSPCHPLRTADHVRHAYQIFQDSGATSLVSITEFPCPLELSLEIVDNRVMRHWKGAVRKENYKKRYYPNGAIMMVKRDYFSTHKDGYSDYTVGYEMYWPDCLDIDNARDFDLAEQLIQRMSP